MKKFDEVKAFEKQNKRIKKQLLFGLKHGLVFPYPNELFDILRPYSYGGFPASIMLLIDEMNNGRCYDRARIMQLAFKDATVVHADINSLRMVTDPSDGSTPEHAFVETKAFGKNRTWVVDASSGFVFDKRYYYLIERPKVNRVFKKEELMKDWDVLSVLASDFEKDKWVLPLVMPIIEGVVEHSNCLTTLGYRDKIKKELAIFKKAIHYDELEREVREDSKLMYTDPEKLDAKFGIVRDKYGREMSRNGVPNPYYKSIEDIEKDNEIFEAIKNNEEKRAEYFARLAEESEKRFRAELDEVSLKASKRMEEILEDPELDFYVQYGYKKEETKGEQENCFKV